MNLALAHERAGPATFQPELHCADALGHYWLRQATLRLRREVAWLWHERAAQTGAPEAGPSAEGRLPPFSDRALASLDLTRYATDRRAFFARDVAAAHLSELIAAPPPRALPAPRGSFSWVAHTLELSAPECFVLALALLPALDSAAGSVIATCQNDATAVEPTLALAQRLWDRPQDMLSCMDPAQPLLRTGSLRPAAAGHNPLWHEPLRVAALVARELIQPGGALPRALRPIDTTADDASRLPAFEPPAPDTPGQGLRILPIVAPAEAPLQRLAAACAQRLGLVAVQADLSLGRECVAELLTVTWLRGLALYLPLSTLIETNGHDRRVDTPLPGLPHLLLAGTDERANLALLPPAALPPVQVAALGYEQRAQLWRRLLPAGVHADHVAELARRFRHEQLAIEHLAAALSARSEPPDWPVLLAAAQRDLDPGTLAQRVAPRFTLGELMLPPAQTRQMEEIVTALRNLTRTHHTWGTAKAWNEAGLAVLFAGPPGTGKTMAAEAIATELALPLYRIDLSQVVNKYIGETEKNLRRLFDQAEAADVILFFDEADALFGKRSEVRDAHDRYANLEISYLLERMERFKGLAILATNRRKDLDEAFLRRLRYVVQFPLPEAAERERIWRAVIPAGVDAQDLDIAFLAQRFPLSGGHIRAAVFQACLQSAAPDAPRVLTMAAVMGALAREYDKLERAISREQFGAYAHLVQTVRNMT